MGKTCIKCSMLMTEAEYEGHRDHDTAEKARRVDHALRTERDTLRRMPTTETSGENIHVANTLVSFINNADEDTKVRLFDLIVGNDTKDAALQSLEDAGAQEGRPEIERDLQGVIRGRGPDRTSVKCS